MDIGNVSFATKAINNWTAILIQAQKEGKTARLMRVTFKDYPENEKLSKGWHDYLVSVESEEGNELFELTPKRNIGWSLARVGIVWIAIGGIIVILGTGLWRFLRITLASGD